MKNTSTNSQFPRKARSSSRTRFGAQTDAPKKIWGKTTRPKGPSPIRTRAPGEFPMRINKYLAWKGYATRQGADEMIKRRSVTLNGRLAILGDQVQETDVVELRSNRQPETYVYYAYNKPRGITTEPTLRGKDISQSITLKGVFPVGGLDANSEGLIILTNDRRIVNRLLNPAHAHMKEYVVRTINPVKPNFKEKMESGIVLDHGRGRGAKRTESGTPTNIPAEMPIQCTVHMMRDNLFSIRVTENDSRVRQMCSLFFAEIENLTRTEVLNIRLEKLPPNSYRKIEGEELKVFLTSLGL
jgi:pseudouridine synthase